MPCNCCGACFECCDINGVTIYDPFGNPYTLTFLGTIDLSDFVCITGLTGECAWQLTEVEAHGCLFSGAICTEPCEVDGFYNLIFWCQDIAGTITPRFAWERYYLDGGGNKVCCESDSCTVTCTVVDNVAVWNLGCITDAGAWTADIT